MKNNVIIIYGPQASGKTHLIQKLTFNEKNVLRDNLSGEHTPKEYFQRIKKIKKYLKKNYVCRQVIKTLILEGDCNCIEELLIAIAGETIPVERIFIEITTNITLSNIQQLGCDLSLVKVEKVNY